MEPANLSKTTSLSGLYVITDPGLLACQQLLPAIEQALEGGVKMVQYRNKKADAQTQKKQSKQLKQLCQQYQIPLIINDNITLAAEIHADGVHIGQHDQSIQHARNKLGSDAIIGVSCYNQLELAEKAASNGANYIAFGRFFASKTKPEAIQAMPAIIRQFKQNHAIPVAAIGGINHDNGHQLIAAGADMLALIHGVIGQNNIYQAAQAVARLFIEHEPKDT